MTLTASRYQLKDDFPALIQALGLSMNKFEGLTGLGRNGLYSVIKASQHGGGARQKTAEKIAATYAKQANVTFDEAVTTLFQPLVTHQTHIYRKPRADLSTEIAPDGEYDTFEAAQLLGITYHGVRSAINRETLKAHKLGVNTLICIIANGCTSDVQPFDYVY